MLRRFGLCFAIVVLVVPSAFSSPMGTSIGINFGIDEPDGQFLAEVLGPAGIFGSDNWNNFEGPESFAAEPLTLDTNGAASASSATVEWISTNTWSSDGRTEFNNFAEEGDDRALMLGYLDQNTVPFTIEVDVADLDPVFVNGGYDVYVYIQGGVNGRGGEYTIGDETIEHEVTEAFEGEYLEWDGVSGNYIVFEDLSDPGFTIEALNTIGATARAPINAIEIIANSAGGVLQAGDADQNLTIDQLDIVQILSGGKYLSGQSATWGEGDFDGAPGGSVGSPPPGNGFFDQLDVVAMLANGLYLTGPYGALAAAPGDENDEQTSLIYDPNSGELSVDAPASTQLTSIFVTSAGNMFVGDKPPVLDGPFDSFAPDNIFKSTIGSSFGDSSFGNVLPAGLSRDDVVADLSASGSLAGGGGLGDVDLVYVPEPSTILLLIVGLAGMIAASRNRAG